MPSRIIHEPEMVDLRCFTGEYVQVEVQDRATSGLVLYVHVNGGTVLRLEGIEHGHLEMVDNNGDMGVESARLRAELSRCKEQRDHYRDAESRLRYPDTSGQ